MNNYEVTFTLRFTNTEWVEADTPEEAQQLLSAIAFQSYKVLFDKEALEFDDIVIDSIQESGDDDT
jgi:hypothetical protein